MKKANLVIAPVGDRSCHGQWLEGAEREYDLMLVYFGTTPNKYRDDAEYYFHIQGLFKLEAIAAAIRKSIDVVREYDAVFLPDDDIRMNASGINRLFRYFHKYNLDLAQPAVIDGKFSHSITRQDRNCVLRYVNFVEMMCPVFKTDLLLANLDTFTLNRSGWGIDFLWSKNLKDKILAVIDDVGVFHGMDRPPMLEGEYYNKLQASGIDPCEELDVICNRYDCNIVGKMVEHGRIEKTTFARMFGYCKTHLDRISESVRIRGVSGTLRRAIAKLRRR